MSEPRNEVRPSEPLAGSQSGLNGPGGSPPLGSDRVLTPLERAKAGLDVTMSCAYDGGAPDQHRHCKGIVHWNGEPVGKCACECHEGRTL